MTIAELISNHPFQFWIAFIILSCSISEVGRPYKLKEDKEKGV